MDFKEYKGTPKTNPVPHSFHICVELRRTEQRIFTFPFQD